MATITKRGNSFRATVSLYKKGQYKRETKTFSNKQDAELWALEMELEKGRGKDIAERSTLFTDFYRNWVNSVKQNEVREATFVNYKRTLVIVDELFEGMRLKHLDDLVGMATVFLTNFIRCRTSFRMLFRLSLTMSLLGCDDLRQELTVKVRLPR